MSQIHVETSVVKLCRDVSDCVMHAWYRAHMQIVATHDVLVVSDMCELWCSGWAAKRV